MKQVLSKGTSVVLITSLTLTRLWTYIYKCGSALRESEEKAKHTHCHTDKQTGEERTEEGRREKGSEQRHIAFFPPSPSSLDTPARTPPSAEQLQAWCWAWPEWRRYSRSPSSPGPPPTPTPTTVRDSCSPSSPISPQLKHICVRFSMPRTLPLPPWFCSVRTSLYMFLRASMDGTVRDASSSSVCRQTARKICFWFGGSSSVVHKRCSFSISYAMRVCHRRFCYSLF